MHSLRLIHPISQLVSDLFGVCYKDVFLLFLADLDDRHVMISLTYTSV